MFYSGIGYDTHRLVAGRDLVLGGVKIPFEKGLDGHSDADCLVHAIMDALLGAALLPDIGHLFPNTDAKWKGANSLRLLEEVARRVRAEGLEIANIDTMLQCERPKLAPHLGEMRRLIAEASGCARVNVKATTTEGMNAEGAGLCISAFATCALFTKA